jgi:hypothetical protein
MIYFIYQQKANQQKSGKTYYRFILAKIAIFSKVKQL